MERAVLLEFLEGERMSVLAVSLNSGGVHVAAMHFSFRADPLELFFSADRTQRKFRPLISAKTCSAAVVVGLSEEKWVTCQMSGALTAVADGELAAVKTLHYERIPSARQFENDPNTTFLRFVPEWIRLTDYNTDVPTVLFTAGGA